MYVCMCVFICVRASRKKRRGLNTKGKEKKRSDKSAHTCARATAQLRLRRRDWREPRLGPRVCLARAPDGASSNHRRDERACLSLSRMYIYMYVCICNPSPAAYDDDDAGSLGLLARFILYMLRYALLFF